MFTTFKKIVTRFQIFTLEQGMVEIEYEGCDPLGKWFEVSDDVSFYHFQSEKNYCLFVLGD